jgi:hypothetical protein
MGVPANEPTRPAPFFGKHQSWAYSPVEKAAYIFGGDGPGSSEFHFGRIKLGTTPPVFDHFHPYWGVAGQPVPAGYDCAPFCYDSKRNCFWQIGGYSAGGTTGWVGVPFDNGLWRFDPVAGGFGTWSRVGASPSYTWDEGMSSLYYARTDHVVGLQGNKLWWYRPSDGVSSYIGMVLADNRDTGRYCAPAYDAVKDELLFVTPINGRLVAAKMSNFPASVTTREVAVVPKINSVLFPGWSQIGQFPTLFVPSRRVMVLFYIDGIKVVNVDTGAVTNGPAYRAPGTGAYINAAIYSPEIDAIAGTYKDSRDVTILNWGGAVVPPPIDPPPIDPPPPAGWFPASGQLVSVGNTLQSIDPDPTNSKKYSGGGGASAILSAWGGSVYASEFGALGSILLWNGGDGDYWGNQVSRFDFESLKWYRMTEPTEAMTGNVSADSGYDQTLGLHAPGQPAVPHGYDGLQYVPPSAAHPLGMLAASVRLYCYGPRSPARSAYFDIENRTWDVPPSARQTGALNCVTSIYDPVRNRIWYRGDGTTTKLGYVDLNSLVHSFVPIPGVTTNSYATSCYVPGRDLWLSLGKINDQGAIGLSAVDMTNPAGGSRNVSLNAQLPLWDASIDWCPGLDCAFVYSPSDRQACYKLTPGAINAAWLVTRIVMPGPAIPYANLPFSKWRWASKLGAFYLLTKSNAPVFVFKP